MTHDKFDALQYAIKTARPLLDEVKKTQEEIYRIMITPDYTRPFTPKRILRHGIATIVFWPDGTKTVVKRHEDEPDNEYAAFTAALAIKVFGSNSKVKSVIRTQSETHEEKKPNRAIRKGDKVKYARRCSLDGQEPFGHRWYPEIGVVGEVLCVCSDGDAQVQWPAGATSGDGCWFCPSKCLEVVG